jgi:hypothetical protein
MGDGSAALQRDLAELGYARPISRRMRLGFRLFARQDRVIMGCILLLSYEWVKILRGMALFPA